LLDFGRERMSASLQVVSDVRVPEPQFSEQARYIVENDRPGPQAV